MLLQLDHLSVIAPSLEEGVAHVRECLDLDVPFGRRHDGMPTHNHLLRLGDAVYLEIIALDPEAPIPDHPIWFGLGDARAVRSDWDNGFRLRGWLTRTGDIDEVLIRHGAIFGKRKRLTGSNGSSFFVSMPPDGTLPLYGLVPTVIDRLGKPPSIAAMADLGAEFQSLILEHPEPDRIADLYGRFEIDTPPDIVQGDRFRYRALIKTAGGLKELT